MPRSELGANCLAGLFLAGRSVIDAHRAALDRLAAAGFAVTEISAPGLLPLLGAAPVRRHAEAGGLKVRAVHAPPMRRDPTLARQRAAAELAAELGASILVIHVSSIRFASPDEAVRHAARERDLHRLDALMQICSPIGIRLGLENGYRPGHPEYLLTLLAALEGRESIRALSPELPLTPSRTHPPPASRVPAPSSPAGLVFDSGHAALHGSDPIEALRTMLPSLIHTHLHDNGGDRDEHLAPGQGIIDWPKLLSVLDKGCYTGARLLELAPRRGGGLAEWDNELMLGRQMLSVP